MKDLARRLLMIVTLLPDSGLLAIYLNSNLTRYEVAAQTSPAPACQHDKRRLPEKNSCPQISHIHLPVVLSPLSHYVP